MLEDYLTGLIKQALAELDLDAEEGEIELSRPALAWGDYSTNVAMGLARRLNRQPLDLAELLRAKLLELKDDRVAEVTVAGPGFVNFRLATGFLTESLKEILVGGEAFGRTKVLTGKKVLIEYTDPNPFKEFHIGHLMSNSIGEAISRLIEANGAETKRVCYSGDIGLHVAKALWGIFKREDAWPADSAPLSEKVKFLGQAYALGAAEYETGTPEAKEGIIIINKKLYKRNDPKLNHLYDLGRRWSLDYFELIYARLGTKFDHYFFESEAWTIGQKLVELGLTQGVFRKSDGAIIFPGADYDPSLHTRVFINSAGVTTYEAKDLGLAKLKEDFYPADLSLTITSNEQTDYFKVVHKALEQILPEAARKTRHLPHGFLRLPSGKMSSRTGQVIPAESLLAEAERKVLVKLADRDLTEEVKAEIATGVAIGAIKYSILKQTPGKDIVFDFEKSLSFEGDSGPYLQYTYARARSVLKKAGPGHRYAAALLHDELTQTETDLLRLLTRLPEVVESAYRELAPQQIVSYLLTVAGGFNRFYVETKIIGADNEAYYLALTEATAVVLDNGLRLLAIPVLEKM